MIDKLLSLTGGGGSGGGGGASLEGQTIVTATITPGPSIQAILTEANAYIEKVYVRYTVPVGANNYTFFGVSEGFAVKIPICKQCIKYQEIADLTAQSAYQSGNYEVTYSVLIGGESENVPCNSITEVLWSGTDVTLTADWRKDE